MLTVGGEQPNKPRPAEQLPPEELADQPTNEQLIHQGITEALRDDRPIDHATARCIAAQLHGGQDSALYALASSGALPEGLTAELDGIKADAILDLEPWLDALDEYLDSRDDEGPVEGWPELWPASRAHDEDEPASRAEVDSTSQPEDTTPGTMACAGGRSVVRASVEPPQDQDDEQPDQPAEHHAILSAIEEARTHGKRLTDETAAAIAEALSPGPGSALACLAGCGAILNDHDAISKELYDGMEDQSPEHQVMADALLSYCAGRQDSGPRSHWLRSEAERTTTSGLQPQIWLASLSDYNHGVLHGVWVDAFQDTDAIQETLQWILRTSPTARHYGETAEEFAIHDYTDFGGYQVNEWANLDTVSMIARGIAEHGPAYAAWVDLVGEHSDELLDEETFHDHYLGEWDSLTSYVEHVLEETDFPQQLDEALERIPDDLRRHVTVDVKGIAEEWNQGLHVVETEGGQVMIFAARA